MTSRPLDMGHSVVTSRPELEELLDLARKHVMSPAEVAAQRASFIRAMMPAGHDMTPEQILARVSVLEHDIAACTCWGAALAELNEERQELVESLAAKVKS